MKFHGDRIRPSPDELRARLQDAGLEEEGRLRLVQERDPRQDRAEDLRRVLAEGAETGQALWATFDWMQEVDLEKTLARQEALTPFVADRPVTT